MQNLQVAYFIRLKSNYFGILSIILYFLFILNKLNFFTNISYDNFYYIFNSLCYSSIGLLQDVIKFHHHSEYSQPHHSNSFWPQICESNNTLFLLQLLMKLLYLYKLCSFSKLIFHSKCN